MKSDRKTTFTITVFICVLWSCTILFGCKKAKQTPTKGYGIVSFTIEWDSLLMPDIKAENLRFCFYPSGSEAMIQTESDSGKLRMALPSDVYRLLVYNCGDRHIQLRRNDFNRVEAFLPFYKSEEAVVSPVAPLYGAVLNSLVVDPNQDISMTLTPVLFTKCVRLKVYVKEAKLFSDCSLLLSGIPPLMYLSDRKLSMENSLALPIPLEKTDFGFEGVTYILDGEPDGKPGSASANQFLFQFFLADGREIASSLYIETALWDKEKQDLLFEVEASLAQTPEGGISLTCKETEMK
ncbi:DUF5119 domain-containing protein [Parabacteroides sp. 52]|uniref:DUF5119 domain-containing protein n=1 Tax=unclassified Parabacteroides TaxID=2649774 RepID=UPI0013D550E4|nr:MULTISPECIES: DUF5119 domain-containing protein [unclassified Parabacteroides]MDH6535747.1 hypothetical protein [Parabacteroides sp. PM5-20]NDV56364.1 DUF5119 domain-containing protein [Parabacteroides sp. 52]